MTWTSFNNRFLHICASFCYLNSSKIANKSDGVQATVLALPACRKVRKMDFQSQFSMSKIMQIFLNFFSLKNTNLEAHFLLLAFFDKINFLTTLLLKLGQIFDEVAKLGKSTQDAYNPGKWLIL